jgi:hypothetical protein
MRTPAFVCSGVPIHGVSLEDPLEQSGHSCRRDVPFRRDRFVEVRGLSDQARAPISQQAAAKCTSSPRT